MSIGGPNRAQSGYHVLQMGTAHIKCTILAVVTQIVHRYSSTTHYAVAPALMTPSILYDSNVLVPSRTHP